MEHSLGSDMNLFGTKLIYMIIFVSGFKFQEISVMLVAALINFGLKKQVPQVSFKIVAGDLISLQSLGSDMKIFGYNLFSDLIIFFLGFKIQELTV